MGDIQTMRVIEWMLRGSSISRAVCPKQMTCVGSSPISDTMERSIMHEPMSLYGVRKALHPMRERIEQLETEVERLAAIVDRLDDSDAGVRLGGDGSL